MAWLAVAIWAALGIMPCASSDSRMQTRMASKVSPSCWNRTSLLVGETLTSIREGSISMLSATTGKRRSGVRSRKAWSRAMVSVRLFIGRPLT